MENSECRMTYAEGRRFAASDKGLRGTDYYSCRSVAKNSSWTYDCDQIIRCGTSVGANYRAACRARSVAEFIAKLGIVIEEADESAFWLELIIESNLFQKERIEPLLHETEEIISIMVSSPNSARDNSKKK